MMATTMAIIMGTINNTTVVMVEEEIWVEWVSHRALLTLCKELAILITIDTVVLPSTATYYMDIVSYRPRRLIIMVAVEVVVVIVVADSHTRIHIPSSVTNIYAKCLSPLLTSHVDTLKH